MALARQHHAPSNIGFMHTSKDQFTYFLGDEAGARDTFGMSYEELADLVWRVAEDYKNDPGNDRELKKKFSDLASTLRDLKIQGKKGFLYQSSGELARSIVEGGHIPVMLSYINAARSYTRAATTIHSGNVEFYITHSPGSVGQCRQFAIKQDMMRKIAAFRNELYAARHALSRDNASFYDHNNLLNILDNQIIKRNFLSMPREHETFDYLDTFIRKVMDNIDQLENNYLPLIEQLTGAMNVVLRDNSDSTPYETQQKLTNALYDVLVPHLKRVVNYDANNEETVNLTPQQDKELQDLLSLVAYLNSAESPFARNGLFGETITNSFHKEALSAYQTSESLRHTIDVYREGRVTYQPKPRNNHDIFSDEQIDILLCGREAPAPRAAAAPSLFGWMSSAITSAAVPVESAPSQSDERREQLALPVPREYLQLTYHPTTPSNRP